QGMVDIVVETPSGTELNQTREIMEEVNSRVTEFDPLIQSKYMTMGGSGMGFGTTSNQATLSLQLVPSTERGTSTEQVAKELGEKLDGIPGADIQIMTLSSGFSSGSPVQVQLNGQDHETLKLLADEIAW